MIFQQIQDELLRHSDVEKIRVVDYQPRGSVTYLCASRESDFVTGNTVENPAVIQVNTTDFLVATAEADAGVFLQLNDDPNDTRMKTALGKPVVYE